MWWQSALGANAIAAAESPLLERAHMCLITAGLVMPILGPMTLIVVLVLGACMVLGLKLIRRGLRRRRTEPSPPTTTERTCPGCGTVNRNRARFCGQCGARLAR